MVKHCSRLYFIFPAAIMLSLLFVPGLCAKNKKIVGWVENVSLAPGNIVFKAKLDTGAKTCSLNCGQIVELKKNDEDWLQCILVDDKGKSSVLERKIKKDIKIKRHFEEKQKRPVVTLNICLGEVCKEVEVNLVDRKGFNYQLLIGRNFLKDDFLVDASKTFTIKPGSSQKVVK